MYIVLYVIWENGFSMVLRNYCEFAMVRLFGYYVFYLVHHEVIITLLCIDVICFIPCMVMSDMRVDDDAFFDTSCDIKGSMTVPPSHMNIVVFMG